MPTSLVAAACAVLDEDERLASVGACDARTRLLTSMRVVLNDWWIGRISAAQAEGALRALLGS
jgi:hypothetical protein